MLIYHGSKYIIDPPLFGHGSMYNDYGQGFYCTEDKELAGEWVCQTVEGGFINLYNLDESRLNIYELNKANVISWIALLIQNRSIRYSSPIEKASAEYIISHFLPDISDFDAVRGYRADDSYFSYTRAFLSNTITIGQLAEAMRLGDLGIQLCLKSRRSFEHIRFIEAMPADGALYYPKRMSRDMAARRTYNLMLEKEVNEGIYIRDIVTREMTIDELRV